MENEQLKAQRSLERALNKCHEAGLQGGVFDGAFCLWPIGSDPQNESMKSDFFENIEKLGGDYFFSKMNLDGGAGN